MAAPQALPAAQRPRSLGYSPAAGESSWDLQGRSDPTRESAPRAAAAAAQKLKLAVCVCQKQKGAAPSAASLRPRWLLRGYCGEIPSIRPQAANPGVGRELSQAQEAQPRRGSSEQQGGPLQRPPGIIRRPLLASPSKSVGCNPRATSFTCKGGRKLR